MSGAKKFLKNVQSQTLREIRTCMKILFVTPHIKWPLSEGGGIRKWNILQGLLFVAKVDVVVCGNDEVGGDDQSYRGCERILHINPKERKESEQKIRAYGSNIERLVDIFRDGTPQEFKLGDAALAQQELRNFVGRERYSLVWIETLKWGEFLDVGAATGDVVKILDGDDFSWIRNLGNLGSTPFYGAKILEYIDLLKMRHYELSSVRRYSCVVRCSTEDAKRQGGNNVEVITNGTYVPSSVNRTPETRAIFVGFLGYEPNRIGLEWFLSKVWPRIVAEVPSANLDVVGKKPSVEILRANGKCGVSVHGFVENLDSFYEKAMFSVVPLRAGGGTRLKILESIAREVPVIATNVGAYGIPLGELEGVIRRNGVVSFARQCILLFQKTSHDVQIAARVGREIVATKFDWSISRRAVVELAKKYIAN